MSVESFNALPQPQRLFSGLPNHWHFDLRYIPLEPTPSHLLFLVQLDSGYIHGERLPLGIPHHQSGIAFFPESGTEAAQELSKAILHAFVDGFVDHKIKPHPSRPFAPLTLTTEDPDLAKAVGEEFTKIGIRRQLCHIGVAKGKALQIADAAFEGFWKSLKARIGFTGIVAAALAMPNSITFHNFHPKTTTTTAHLEDDSDDEDSVETMKAVRYVQRLSSSRPISLKMDFYDLGQNAMNEVQTVRALFKTKSSEAVKKEADEGNAESAIDYALRSVQATFS
jgi:hypothetical protein